MSTTSDKPTVVICDPEARRAIPDGGAFRIIDNPRSADAKHHRNVFVLTTAICLEPIADFVSAVSRRNQLRALFVRYDVDTSWLPQMFGFAKLRTMKNTYAHSDFTVPHRVLRAWQLGAQDELIADARVMGDTLYILSCGPESYRIPIERIAPLRNLSSGDRSSFQVADDGSYLHWPAHDLHLDLDALLTAVEPERKRRTERIKRSYGQQYGGAIGRLRREHGLKQTEIMGLSEREIRRIEAAGEVTGESLRKLAAAHEMELSVYLDALAKVSVAVRDTARHRRQHGRRSGERPPTRRAARG